MIAGLKSVGAAPGFMVRQDWPVVRLWRIATIRSEKKQPELPLLSVFLNRGVISYGEGGGQVHKPGRDLSVYQVVREGDFVLNNQQAWRGSVGVSKYHGIISPAYVVLMLSDSLSPRFADYLVQSRVMVAQYVTSSKGVGDIQRDIHIPWLKNIKVPLPKLDEQDDIVRFLDHSNGRIERMIQAKKKLITLLNEQKQAIIHRAITRGLDSTLPSKSSGTLWIGDIPQNYQRTRLGRVCISIRDGTHNPPPAVPGIHRLLSVRNIINGRFVTRPDDRTMTSSAFAELQRSYTVEPGDIVIAIVGGTTGKSAVVESMEHVTVQRSLGILRPNQKLVESAFLNMLISSEIVQSQIKRIMDKYAAQPGIYLAELGGLQVIYPPTDDQKRIVSHINEESATRNSTINRTEREIGLLREYRTGLIADVVTGRVDVREGARQLPAAPENVPVALDDEELDEEADA